MPIDPRIRERRIEVIREAGRRRLRITLVVASAVLVVGLAFVVVHSPMLDVDHVRVTGAHREPVAAIDAAARVRTGQPLLYVDAGAVAKRVEQLPWVRSAHVARDFPGTVAISVTEYVPTAYVRAPHGQVALVASTGRVVAMAHAPPSHAVEIRGVRAIPAVGALLSPPGVADVVGHLPARLAARIVAVDVGGAVIALDVRGGGAIRIGTIDHLAAKGAAALAVLDHLAGAPFRYIDVTAPAAPSSR